MINITTKINLLSRQLDIAQNTLERLRTHKFMPIELKGDITEAMLKMRAIEKVSDVGVSHKRTGPRMDPRA